MLGRNRKSPAAFLAPSNTKNGVFYSVPLFKTKCKVLADASVITAGKVYAGLIFVFE